MTVAAHGRLRTAWRSLRDAVCALAIAVLLATLIGQLIGDRFTSTATFMYLPALFVGIGVLLLDLLRRGRTVRGPRFSLAAVALACLAIETPQLVGLNGYDARDDAKPAVRVLHWNVMWGGNWDTAAHWGRASDRIIAQNPDVIVLSESPIRNVHVQSFCRQLGADWTFGKHTFTNAKLQYYCRMHVLSRWPVRCEYVKSDETVTVSLMRIDAPKPIRLMTVDAISGPGDKRKMFRFVADAVREDGRVDLLCGDFNALARSHDFGRLSELGYSDVSTRGFGWRATWPTVLPVYDLDHIVVRPGVRVLATEGFSESPIDHRGRVAELQLD